MIDVSHTFDLMRLIIGNLFLLSNYIFLIIYQIILLRYVIARARFY